MAFIFTRKKRLKITQKFRKLTKKKTRKMDQKVDENVWKKCAKSPEIIAAFTT